LTWKTLHNGHFARTGIFGGEDIDKIMKVFNGSDGGDSVDINSNTTIRSGNMNFRNPANTFSYDVTVSAITADRNATLPALTSDQEFLFENVPQTMTNKSFTNCVWESTGTGTSRFVGDPIPMRWGAIFPNNIAESTSGAAAREGLLSAHTLRNTNGNPRCEWTSSGSTGYGGQSIRFENLISNGDYSGIISPTTGVGTFRMSHDGLVRIRVSQEEWIHSAVVFGLSSSSAAPLNTNTPLSNSQSGIVITNSESLDWGFTVLWHNGDGTTPERHLLAPLSNIGVGNNIFKDIQIKWWHGDHPRYGPGLHSYATINNTYEPGTQYQRIMQGVDLPAENTDLYLHAHFINTSSSNTNEFHVAGVWAESL
jgi:hypothetical protein